MRKRLTILTLLIGAGCMATMAFAQAPGDIGIFFDAAGTQVAGSVLTSVPFFLYVVGFDVPGDVFGYEFSFYTSIPGTYFVLSAIAEPLGTATNFGSTENWIVGTGVCYTAQGPALLGTFNLLVLVPPPVDTTFCLAPATPSSFSPPAPGYVTCIEPTDLRTFGTALSGAGIYPDGCAVGNPCCGYPPPPIANGQTSWGALKAAY